MNLERTITPVFLAAALSLSTATQLRLSSMPLGPGELALVAFLGWIGLRLLRGPDRRLSEVGRVFGVFWLVALLALLAGAWMGKRAGVALWGPFLHDAAAYGFVACFSLALSWRVTSEDEARRLLWWLAFGMFLGGSVLWVYGHIDQHWLGLNLWYGGLGVRFLGWAVNPNQMALLLVLTPFLGMYCLTALPGGFRPGKALLVMLVACAVAAGWATDSGALRAAWSLCLPLLALAYGVVAFKKRSGHWQPLMLLVVVVLLAAAMLMLARHVESASLQRSDPAVSGAPQQAPATAMESIDMVYVQTNDVDVRRRLLRHGWEALLSSPVLGLGPGAFSGLDRPFQGSEAHNSLIDWGTNTGMVGMAALIALLGWLALQLLRGGQWALLAGLVALAVYSLAHHVLRHPLVWAWLVMVAQLAYGIRRGDSGKCAA